MRGIRKVAAAVGVVTGVAALAARWFDKSLRNAVEGAWR